MTNEQTLNSLRLQLSMLGISCVSNVYGAGIGCLKGATFCINLRGVFIEPKNTIECRWYYYENYSISQIMEVMLTYM